MLTSFNEHMRTTFSDLFTPSSVDTSPRRTDIEMFILGVICGTIKQSDQERVLVHSAHEDMMRRVQVAQGVFELRKAVLNRLPLCVFAKPVYPDWTSGDMWMNKRGLEVLRVDPNECPNQTTPLVKFMEVLAHPATFESASAHTAFSLANHRQNCSNYQVWIRIDGTPVAGLYSNHYVFGPPPLYRCYFTYVFFQPLPIQPVYMDAWARSVMIRHPNGNKSRGWTAAGTSAKYPGIMHKLIQDHMNIHPEDKTLPPHPATIQ
jgi:hypothetical protein